MVCLSVPGTPYKNMFRPNQSSYFYKEAGGIYPKKTPGFVIIENIIYSCRESTVPVGVILFYSWWDVHVHVVMGDHSGWSPRPC